jgi:tetratricopeptide (TPR) repeat protein
MSLGFEQVMADWYWVKALQYFTDPVQAYNRYKNLGDILDVVTGVDPDFRYAYKFAGIAVPYDTGRLHWANTDHAIELLERGVTRFPDDWEIQFYLGFSLLNFRKETGRAAEHFAAAARIPGSPPYLKAFAARLFAAGGDIDRALVFAETMLERSTDAQERRQLEQRIQSIRLEGQLRALEEAARRFQKEEGRWPSSPFELTARYGLPAPPPGVTLVDGVASAPPGVERMIVYIHPTEGEYRTTQ